MQSAEAIRDQRRASAKALNFLAIGGVTLTLGLSASLFALSRASHADPTYLTANAALKPIDEDKIMDLGSN